MTVQLLTVYTNPESHNAQRTDRRADRRHYDANSQSYCVTVRSAKTLCFSWCRGSPATQFQFILITDRQPHPTVYRRRPSFSGRRCSCLEQSAWACHFRTFCSCLPVAGLKTHLFTISYPSSLWLYSACAVTLSCFWQGRRLGPGFGGTGSAR